MNDEISPCPKCGCMTKSIRLGRARYQCGKCKADKSLSDVYFYEATHKNSDQSKGEGLNLTDEQFQKEVEFAKESKAEENGLD